MKNLFAILILLLIIPCPGNSQNKTGESNSKIARIKFVDKGDGHVKTYLGKLGKGDLYSLQDYLTNLDMNSVKSSGSLDNEVRSNTEVSGYVNQITSAPDKKKKKKSRNSYLLDDMNESNQIFDKKYYKKHYGSDESKKESKLNKKQKEKRVNPQNESYKKYTEDKRKPVYDGYLAKYYKISGRRLRNGHVLKFPEGNVTFIIKYKVYKDGMVKTFVNIVSGYVKAGSDYELKYYGAGEKRKYYIELSSIFK